MRLRRNSRSHSILAQLALATGVVIVSTVAPAAGARIVQEVVKAYFRKKQFARSHFLRDLKNLQRRDLIDYRDLGDGRVSIRLTAHGREKILEYNIDNLKLKPLRRWDGRWRLILFDIPHSKKQARDALRRKLISLKFYPLQKSVFITPYPCEEEIDFIASVFDIRKHILVLYVGRFEGEEKLRHHFNI